MTNNPFYNALTGLAYIVILVSIAILGPHALGGPEESILYPMAGLAVFTLSAAVMAYLFFYRPVLLLLDGKRTEAVKFFFQTVAIFAVGTGCILLLSVLINR